MNRIIRIILLLWFLPIIINAQNIKSYGLHLGVNFSKHDYKGFLILEDNLKRRIGFTGGLYVEWLNSSIFTIVTQIEYLQRGEGNQITKTDINGNPAGTVTTNSRLDYLSFPVFGKITIPIQTKSIYTMTGIHYDILLGHSEFMENIYSKLSTKVIGGIIGIGFSPNFKVFVKPSIEICYVFDFTDSYKPGGYELRNNAIECSMKIPF